MWFDGIDLEKTKKKLLLLLKSAENGYKLKKSHFTLQKNTVLQEKMNYFDKKKVYVV